MASNRSDLTTIHGRNIRLLLQAVVRSTQWTYSIFWRFSPSRGLLVWREGFYNGDVERSLQLRELFHSLKSEEEINQPSSKQCVALSPEDLTDTDWFFLVSMSFDFAPVKCLPGRALANRCPVWLCRANEVEARVFSRALLAKSAGIQTVACIPLMDGVLELGVTKLTNKESILGEAIEYLKHLQRRVLELEAHKKQTEVDHNGFQEQNPIDGAIIDKQDEELSDEKHFSRVKKLRDANDQLKSLRMDKRKVRVVEGSATSPMETGEGSMAEIEVSINDEKALLQLKCCWKKGLLLQILQTLSSFHLEIYESQSSRVQHNYFVATIKAIVIQQVGQTRNGQRETIGRVKEAIQRVVL
uniref:Transcription factor bHLH-3 n=1 Tax=Picea abies TaxID=3329 RepID=A0A167V975_PICAB|nr:transcription factor bHLH-3 [Picea abies]